MTDNVTANPGVGGAVFATDFNKTESANYPLNKLTFGTRDVSYTVVDRLCCSAE
jgi:hypothetical protein